MVCGSSPLPSTISKPPFGGMLFLVHLGFSTQPLTCNINVAYNPLEMDSDKLFKALSNPIRRLMLDELSDRNEQTFYELCSRPLMKHNVGIRSQALARHLE